MKHSQQGVNYIEQAINIEFRRITPKASFAVDKVNQTQSFFYV